MSVSSSSDDEEEEISNGDRDGYQGGGSDGDDDNDDDDVIGKKKKKKKKKHSKNPGRSFGKRIVLYPFTAAKNKIRRIRSKRALLSSSSSLSTTTISTSSSSSSRNVINVHTRRGKVKDATTSSGCNFCFSRPDVLETPNVSPSDPNHPSFTHSMLKTLIENNDFYSKQCNTHIH